LTAGLFCAWRAAADARPEQQRTMRERLQKLISRAGIASRRHAEQLILAGEVTVNGEVVTELGSKADPATDHVKVRGKLLRFPPARMVAVLNKPAGAVSTLFDPEGRSTIADSLKQFPGRVFPVGRLDYHSEGLLLLTNDGEFADRMMKSRDVWQTYWIKVKGSLSRAELAQLAGRTGARLRLLAGRGGPQNPWLEARMRDARRDALRREALALGHPVEKVKRVAVDGVELGDLAPGAWRMLEPREISALEAALGAARELKRTPELQSAAGRPPARRKRAR
jgi:23S rRNA pseudouridine2605 synthase